MIRSMTAFASRTGGSGLTRWQWDLRSVNGRGLDLRLRIPDGMAALESEIRRALAARITRGSVTVSLRLTRDEGERSLDLDAGQLERVLSALELIAARAQARGIAVATASAAEVLAVRGVWVPSQTTDDQSELQGLLLKDFMTLLEEFSQMRQAEGGALFDILSGQLAQIELLVAQAAQVAQERRAPMETALKEALGRIVQEAVDLDPGRVAQELALIALKTDVTEELDRLRTHVPAARAVLTDAAPAGRKLDFLAQEFNREANTLCSKSQNTALTAVGLDLKAAIDQMREQIQNVE